MDSRGRRWCMTLNNYTEDEWKKLIETDCNYVIIGKEVCPDTGTNHLQGYFEMKGVKRLSGMKKLNERAHWEIAMADQKCNINYCSKEGNFEERGERKRQGKRTDLKKIADEIIKGDRNVEDVLLEEPMVYHQYGRTLEKIEDLKYQKKERSEMTKGIWYWGETGTGKSHKAFENWNKDTHYNVPDDNGWWDGYKQQDTVIFNDFRGWLNYEEMLKLVDKWPYEVKRRNKKPIPFTSKTVIVTSSLPPYRVYNRRQKEDCIKQLERRFEVICLGKGKKPVKIVNYDFGTEVVKEGNTSFFASTSSTLGDLDENWEAASPVT